MHRRPCVHHEETVQVTVQVKLLPGPYHELVADRLRLVIVEALTEIGADVTEVSLTITGAMASW